MIRFGLFLNKQYPAGESAYRRIQEHVEQVRLARALGFDTIIVGQHFLSEPFQEPQPVPLLARLAAESGEMRIGISIILAALLSPVEVAELGATLDVISGGRFICGLGLGYRQQEYDAFGVPQQGRVKRFEENVRVIQRLWEGERVTCDIPGCRLQDAALTLLPIQQPRPPLWLAANADAAVRRAARLGDTWALNPHQSLPTLKRQLGLYRAELEAAGKPFPADLPLRRDVYIVPPGVSAATEARPFMDAKYSAYRQWGQDAVLPADDHWAAEFEELARDRFIVGDAAFAADELQRYLNEMPEVNHFIFRVQYPGMPQELILRSIRLLAERVRPRLRQPSPASP